MKKLRVLSLFDGISCGQVALNKVGFEVENYYASEIDKYAIQVAMKNYPNTVQIGDVYNIDYSKLEKTIAILITDYELESLKQIPKYQTKWQIREEEYRQVILTDVMELYIIELPKFIKYKENKI